MKLAIFFLIISSAIIIANSTDSKQRKLNIHFVPHTHDDVGWLKTVDQYYYGAKNGIQHAGVQYILDSVIPELLKDPKRHFIYVEIAFFERWWNEQDESMRATVRKLVKGGQLEFINGGWCMNDEATTHYNAIIDQMSLGLRFIRKEFGEEARPTVAWHIDPFGHSAEQASIHAMIGFNSFYFARIDYQDYYLREKKRELQLVWQGSHSLGALSNIFTGVLYKTSYGPPSTFCYDIFCEDPPIQDDPDLFDINVAERVKTFLKFSRKQAYRHRTNHIMVTMGSDFNYMNANNWFKNMDKLMKHINMNERVNAFYSTPSIFTQALYEANLNWTLKTDDFFPYADCPSCFWTGYFTSRPALKGYVRELNSLLQSCRQLEVLAQRKVINNSLFRHSSNALEEAMAVAQHHDAVSGTERQHVADDYARRLHIGQGKCYALLNDAFNLMINDSPSLKYNLGFCEYLNVSSCLQIQNATSFWFVVYNPIGRARRIPLKLPVRESSGFDLKDVGGNNVKFDLFPVSSISKKLSRDMGTGQHELHFIADVPAMGYTRFDVVAHNSNRASSISKKSTKSHPLHDISMKNDKMHVTFSADGKLQSVSDLESGLTVEITQDFWWYESSIGNTGKGHSHQTSGAYIFRPNSSTPLLASSRAEVVVHRGRVVSEVRQTFTNWISQVVRIYEGLDFVEFEYTVGPIPIQDKLGKEIITKFSTSLDTKGIWFTDANGRSMIKRVRNFRPTWGLKQTEPTAGNYYPVNSRIALVDETKGVQLVVLNDRSQGGSSLSDGDIELMVHRRTLRDDWRGVGEPLNELGQFGDGLIIRGKHYLLLKPVKNTRHRFLGEEIMMSPVLAFNNAFDKTDDDLKNLSRFVYSGLAKELPPQIHLLTFTHDNATDNTLLLRLEHMFEEGEDNTTITLSLANLFEEISITSAVELGLAANVKLADIKRLHFSTNNVESSDFSQAYAPPKGDELNITIGPMQIRTFSLTYK